MQASNWLACYSNQETQWHNCSLISYANFYGKSYYFIGQTAFLVLSHHFHNLHLFLATCDSFYLCPPHTYQWVLERDINTNWNRTLALLENFSRGITCHISTSSVAICTSNWIVMKPTMTFCYTAFSSIL